MKIIITGSLGHISKPLAQQLLQKGNDVTIISSNAAKQKDIEAMGATAAVGSIEDPSFLTTIFTGADIVYCMEPPVNFFDAGLDYIHYYNRIGLAYKEAILRSGVKKIIHLSSIGAHMPQGNGLLQFHYNVEQLFNSLPEEVAITFMRPVGFYYNLFSFIPVIKATGAIATNYGTAKEPWVAPIDIAEAITEEMELIDTGRKIRYVASDELTGDELASILGKAIGKPELQWKIIPGEDVLKNLTAIGINPGIAKAVVEMNAARNNELYKDYFNNPPVLSKTKATAFAKEFAAVYNQQ
ncbi:MAG: NmrA family NAD(P)-binding protein [Ferruginibacter sp.]